MELKVALISGFSQAMAAAAQLGSTINVSQVGGLKQDTTSVPISADGSLQEWLTTMVPDEDSQLHQLRAHLLQARDGPVCKFLVSIHLL